MSQHLLCNYNYQFITLDRLCPLDSVKYMFWSWFQQKAQLSVLQISYKYLHRSFIGIFKQTGLTQLA